MHNANQGKQPCVLPGMSLLALQRLENAAVGMPLRCALRCALLPHLSSTDRSREWMSKEMGKGPRLEAGGWDKRHEALKDVIKQQTEILKELSDI